MLWDDEEYYYGTKPLQADSDSDGLDDGIDPNPLTFDFPEVAPGALEVARIIIKGAIFGEMGDTGGWLHFLVGDDSDSAYYLLGAIVGGFIPLSDLRDLFQSLVNLDLLGSMLNAIGFVPGPGDVAKITGIIGIFVVKHASDEKWLIKTGRVLAKHFLKYIPINEIKRAALNTLYNNKATELISRYGVVEDDILAIIDNNGDLVKTIGVAKSGSRVSWLEEGLTRVEAETLGKKGPVGWKHIFEEHIKNFYGPDNQFAKAFGEQYRSAESIQGLIYDCIKANNLYKGVYYKKITDSKAIKAVVGNNGFIVTSQPLDLERVPIPI
jgi:hypothetical protein